MLESAWILLMNSLLLMLRIAPGDSFPKPLSREEEREALARWSAGDLEARNLLVEHNLRLVAHIGKKYYQNDDADDLISIGSIGLIKGINTYRPDKGVRLASYASRCIENETLSLWNYSFKKSPLPGAEIIRPRKWSVLDCIDQVLVVMSRLVSTKPDYAPLYIHSFRLRAPRRHVDAQRVLKKYGREEIRFASAADKLKWYRHSLGLMQEEVANLCNVPRQAYRRLEAGELNLFPHEGMLKIAKLFEIEVEALLDDYNRFMFGGQGDAVRAIRRETGMNIKQFERANGIQHGMVNNWEKERKLLSKHSWEKYYRHYLK